MSLALNSMVLGNYSLPPLSHGGCYGGEKEAKGGQLPGGRVRTGAQVS